jgi:hypothetical protein
VLKERPYTSAGKLILLLFVKFHHLVELFPEAPGSSLAKLSMGHPELGGQLLGRDVPRHRDRCDRRLEVVGLLRHVSPFDSTRDI